MADRGVGGRRRGVGGESRGERQGEGGRRGRGGTYHLLLLHLFEP